MTDDGSPALQTEQEREVNQQLEFDNDWETTQPGTASPEESPKTHCWSSTMSQCVRSHFHPVHSIDYSVVGSTFVFG